MAAAGNRLASREVAAAAANVEGEISSVTIKPKPHPQISQISQTQFLPSA
jgi:hypothetical protein